MFKVIQKLICVLVHIFYKHIKIRDIDPITIL